MAYDLLGLFERVRSHLAADPRASLRRLSEHFGVERHSIERAFQAAAGRSYREFQQQILFEKACGPLSAHPCLTVKEIAALLHYELPRAFARFVRRMSKCSPSELRKRLVVPPHMSHIPPK